MNLLEMVMLIIGIIVILSSCIIVSRPNKKESISLEEHNLKGIYTQEELHSIKEEQNEMLASASEDTIIRTDEYLSKLSNEKILAVSEYSDQVLEKISKNHEEVVFLYNMLNNKEKELKETLKEIDRSRHKAKEVIDKNQKENLPKKDIEKPMQPNAQMHNIKLKTAQLSDIESTLPPISINNSEILKLFRQGSSVLEIAKQLGIGQGEVKLVIDLFSKKR